MFHEKVEIEKTIWNVLLIICFTVIKKVYQRGFGLLDYSVECCIACMEAVRNCFGRIGKVRVHYMELFVEPEHEMLSVIALADNVGRWFFENGYQCLVTVADSGKGYLVAIALNAVSYRDGSMFWDNNACYQRVVEYLRYHSGFPWALNITMNTYFDTELGYKNYQHGAYA